MLRLPRLLNVLLISSSLALLNGCSVGMALSGKKDPNLSIVKKGAERSDVEMQLGSPVKVQIAENGYTTAQYEYEIGGEPSPGRAVAHGAMDFLTLGLWEVVGSPVELFVGDDHTITLTYDKENRVVNVTQSIRSFKE